MQKYTGLGVIIIMACPSMFPKSVLTAKATTLHRLDYQILTFRLLHNFGLSKQSNSGYVTIGTLCIIKHRFYLVFELCDYIHIAAGQLEVQKKLVSDSQHQYHSLQSGYL